MLLEHMAKRSVLTLRLGTMPTVESRIVIAGAPVYLAEMANGVYWNCKVDSDLLPKGEVDFEHAISKA